MRLVDATVAIDALRGVERAVELLLHHAQAGDRLLASEITRFEILAGVLPREVDATERFMGRLTWLPIDEVVSREAAGLARVHRAANRGIDDADYLVAATALLYGVELLTTNVRHFPMFSGLRPAY